MNWLRSHFAVSDDLHKHVTLFLSLNEGNGILKTEKKTTKSIKKRRERNNVEKKVNVLCE